MNSNAISIILLVLLDSRYISRRSYEICGNSGEIFLDLFIKRNKPLGFNSDLITIFFYLLTQCITFYFLTHYICYSSVSTFTQQSDIWL
jgi:hypothetical protein